MKRSVAWTKREAVGVVLCIAVRLGLTIAETELADAKEIHNIWCRQDSLSSLAVSPDGRTLATGGWKGGIMIWDAASGKQITTLNVGEGAILAVAFTPDGKRLAASIRTKTEGRMGMIVVIELKGGEKVFEIPLTDVLAHSLDFELLGDLLAAGTYGDFGTNGAVRTYDAGTGKPRATFRETDTDEQLKTETRNDETMRTEHIFIAHIRRMERESPTLPDTPVGPRWPRASPRQGPFGDRSRHRNSTRLAAPMILLREWLGIENFLGT